MYWRSHLLYKYYTQRWVKDTTFARQIRSINDAKPVEIAPIKAVLHG